MNHQSPWTGLRPARPPAALRERVLSAAREAAARPGPGLIEALYRDRLLRLCAAGLAALVVANVMVAGGGAAPRPLPVPPRAVPSVEGGDLQIPEPGGLTAAEQLDDLAPELGDTIARSRG
jgi:hypothetical protein